MKSTICNALFVLVVAFGATSARAQAPAPSPAAAAASSVTAADASSLEIAVLRAQIETTRQFQDNFISMAQWTLGTAIVVALAIGGFAWYTNKSNYDRDRESLAREVKALGTELRAEIQSHIGEQAQKLERNLDAREKALTEGLAKAIDAKLDAKLSAVRRQLRDVARDLHVLQESALKYEVQKWIDKGVQTNALRKLADLLEHQIKRGAAEYFISQTLEQIMTLAKDNKGSIGADTFAKVNEAIDKLPKGLRAGSEPIVARLKQRIA
jgi:hypothetical protein